MPDTTIQFSLQAQENLSTQFSRVVTSLSSLQTAQASAFGSLQASLDATASKTVSTGNIFSAVFGANLASKIGTEAIGALKDLGSEILKLGTDSVAAAGQFEQTQIAFTAMLDGNRGAADTMLAKLQALANITPFRFNDEADSARMLLAMGQTADKVLPELVDIDTAVSAIGGGATGVGNVTQALSKMDAEGKTSAIFLNELTRNGIPAWRMLADEMGLTVQQVRALSSQGAIASSTFDQAFHDYTVKHFGDALQNQSQTWDGLISTAQDFGQQLERTFGSGIIQSLEPILRGAVAAIQDPAVVDALRQWGIAAGQFLGYIVEAGAEIARMVGIPIPDLNAALSDANTSVAQFAGNWAGTTTATTSAKDAAKGYRDTIAAIGDEQARLDANYQDQIDPLRQQVSLLDQAYQIQTATNTLEDAKLKLHQDQTTAINFFTGAGMAATQRIAADQTAVTRAQAALDHDNQKNKLDNQIAGIEAVKKNIDEQYAQEKRNAEALIRYLNAAPIKSPVDWGAFATSSQQNVDEFRAQFRHASAVDLPATAAANRPALLDALFGTGTTWQTLGTNIGNTVGTAIGSVDWLSVGGHIGNGILIGIGSILGGKPAGSGQPTSQYPGTTAGVPAAQPADATGTPALGQMFVDLAGGNLGGAVKDWGNWTGIGPGLAWLGQQQGSNQRNYWNDPSNYTANPGDFSTYNPFDAIGKAVGRSAGVPGQGTQPVVIQVPVTVNGRPTAQDKAYWDSLGPVISQAVTNYLYGRR
jgi:tape measure domain-containing protein